MSRPRSVDYFRQNLLWRQSSYLQSWKLLTFPQPCLWKSYLGELFILYLLTLVVVWGYLSEGMDQFSSVQSLSCVRLFATPWTATHWVSPYFTISRSLLKLIELVTLFNHLILYCLLLLLPSIFPSIRVFFNELVLRIRWPKYWNFSFSISPSNEYSGLISFRTDRFEGMDRIC